MKRMTMGLALPILFGTACSTSRVEYVATPPEVLDDCPLTLASPGDLPTRQIITLPGGTLAVSLAEANAREEMLTTGLVVLRRAWTECKSVVEYVEQRDAEMGGVAP